MLKAAFALVCAVALCCAQNDAPTSPGTAPGTAPVATPAAAPAKGQLPASPTKAPEGRAGTKAPYVIGPLDVISIKVWNNPNLSSPLDVGPDGMISLPLVGQVKAEGLTKEQLKEMLAGRLK